MSRVESTRNHSASEWTVAVLAIVAGVVAFVQSYLRWLDPFIDAGRDLYIPEQLRHGARLYSDILYFYPPLTPWLLAALPVTSLQSYVVLGSVIALLTAAAMFAIVRPLAGRIAAGAALLLFFALNMCGTGGWGSNYFFPWAHAATLGMLFFVSGAALLWRGHDVTGALLMLAAAWTKIEFAVFGAAVVLFVVVIVRWPLREGRTKRVATALAYLVALAISIAAVFTSPMLRANILPSSLLGGEPARLFYAQVSGIANWRTNLLLSVEGALLIALVVILLRNFERHRFIVVAAVVIVAVLLANATFFRAWTILQLALIPFALRRPRSPLTFLLLLSLCASSRIWLNLAPSWYGVVFTVPLEMLLVYVLFEWLPERRLYSRDAARLWVIVIAVVAISGLLAAHRAYAHATPVSTDRGTYYDTSERRAASVSALLSYLDQVEANELVVMPEGLAINYLAHLPTPLRHQTFTPVEIAASEEDVLRELVEHEPERVALIRRDVREFGYRGFGIDYGRSIVAWLRANYAVEARFGDIVLLTRQPRTPRPDSPSERTPAPTPN